MKLVPLGGLLPEDLTATWWISEYVPKKRAQAGEGRKFFNDRKWLKSFLIHCRDEGLAPRLPKLADVDPEVDAGKVYSDGELERINMHSKGDLDLQILMALTMGMRHAEVMLLQWDRIDDKAWVIHLRAEDTKIGKARSFAMSDPVRAIFAGRKRRGPFVFPSPRDHRRSQGEHGNKKAWERCLGKAGVEGRFHDLRHTFLTRAFKTPGANHALICEYAGLSMAEAQRTYLHVNSEDTRGVANLVNLEGRETPGS